MEQNSDDQWLIKKIEIKIDQEILFCNRIFIEGQSMTLVKKEYVNNTICDKIINKQHAKCELINTKLYRLRN